MNNNELYDKFVASIVISGTICLLTFIVYVTYQYFGLLGIAFYAGFMFTWFNPIWIKRTAQFALCVSFPYVVIALLLLLLNLI